MNLVYTRRFFTVCLLYPPDGCLFGIGGEVCAENIFYNMHGGGVFYQMLLRICGVAVCGTSVQMLSVLFFISKNGSDSFGIPVTFVFVDGKHNVDGKAPVRCGGIIFFKNGFPVAAVGFQYRLCVVIVFDIAEPAVKLCDKD